MKSLKYIIPLIVLLIPITVFAQGGFDPFGFGSGWGLAIGDEGSPAAVAITIVNIALSFLGIVTLIVVLWGGFVYLFARGNTDQASKGRKILFIGVIGLLVVMAAWGVSYFVFNAINDSIGSGSSGGGGGAGDYGFQCQQAGGGCDSSCDAQFDLGRKDCAPGEHCCKESTTSCEIDPDCFCNFGSCDPQYNDAGKRDCGMLSSCCCNGFWDGQ